MKIALGRERLIPPNRSKTGVGFTLAMTHSHGRSCQGIEGVEEGEEWAGAGAEAGVHMASEASTGLV